MNNAQERLTIFIVMEGNAPHHQKISSEKAFERQYTKHYTAEERAQLAKEVREEHAKILAEKKGLREKISSLSEAIEGNLLKLNEVVKKENDLEEELEGRTQSFLREFLNRKRVKALRGEIGVTEQSHARIEEKYTQQVAEIIEMKALLSDRNRLHNLRARIRDFYGISKEDLEKKKGERNVRDVSTLYNVLVVHAMKHNSSLLASTLTKLDFETKLKVVLGLEPSIAASTIAAGGDITNVIASQGVIVRTGDIQYARRSDAYSGVEGGLRGNRVPAGGIPEDQNIAHELDAAILKKGEQGYNELGIKNPEVAGIYMIFNKQGVFDERASAAPEEELHAVAARYHIPVFGIQEGTPHEASYSEEMKHYVLGRSITVEEVLNNSFHVSDNEREKLMQEVIEEEVVNKELLP
ncbi:MAG: hypothetical protein KGI50_04830 [Patescibacteria group bacterium]|nr:hypothetical protein [Patescibacteria group bacterium]MDE2438638.1 hypothetical protein [Patescibacteria group bacterium]